MKDCSKLLLLVALALSAAVALAVPVSAQHSNTVSTSDFWNGATSTRGFEHSDGLGTRIVRPVSTAWSQASTAEWGVKILGISRPEITYMSFLIGDFPEVTKVGYYGEGKAWLQVTVAVTPPKDPNIPIRKINVDGHPLVAIAYQAKPADSIVYKFVVRGEGTAQTPTPEDPSPPIRPGSGSVYRASGSWTTIYVGEEKSGKMTPVGSGFFDGGRKNIMSLFIDRDTKETSLAVLKKPPVNIILVFAVPADAKELTLTFGDAVVPVVITT